MNKKIDFLAIGDITTDAFIRIKEASVSCDIYRDKCKLCLNFGDKIPFEYVEVVKSVGNSPNASVSASKLGLNSALLTDLGDDQNGKDCLETLKEKNIITDFVRIHENEKTNYHYVLWFEEERTILVNHIDYKHELPEIKDNPKWIYLSSVGENSLEYHDEIANYLEKNPDVNMAFQPGTFQMKMGSERLSRIYKNSKVLFCNVEESKKILGIKEKVDIMTLLKGIHNLGPKIVSITDGPKGAYAYDGENAWFMPPYPDPKPPMERTGAGDAYSSTFTTALALGKSVEEAIQWGPINSMSVVQNIGAQAGLLTREELENFLKTAPENYKPEKIN